MSLLNAFKKKKIEKEKKEKSKEIKKFSKKDKPKIEIKSKTKKKNGSGLEQVRPSTSKVADYSGLARLPSLGSGPGGQAYKVLENLHITEKATDLAKGNQYVFKVSKGANKIEIKRAIKSLYKVDVQKVRIVNIPSRRVKLGRTEGWAKGYKKAIVKIKKGQKIEILPR